jgi:uncharacterized membrane-anchored protein YitT (DUF2179 family)
MAYKEGIGENGQLPLHKLKKVEPKEKLYRVAANSYIRMRKEAKKQGVNLELNDAYRICGRKGDYSERNCSMGFTQWCAWEKYQAGVGNLASDPTTSEGCKSNHGYGLAIDVKNTSGARDWIRENGEKYGWWWSGGTFSQIEDWHFDYDKERDIIRKKKIKSNLIYASIFVVFLGVGVGLFYATRKK